MHKNGPGPTGWALKSTLAALPHLEIEPLFPAHGALLSPISGPNATVDNFETASGPSASSLKCSASSSLLLIVDIQQQLGQAMPGKVLNRVVSNSALLARSAGLLDVPVLRTEQYPKGLGPTVPEILEVLPETSQSFEKTSFSSVGADGFSSAVESSGRRQVTIVGMEAHVCVLQTALDLLANEMDVFVVEDAVCSRRLENYQNALDRLRQTTAQVVSAESVIFEWLVDSRHDQFRAIQAMLR